MRVCLGVTGSVAAILTQKLFLSLQNDGHIVSLVTTQGSKLIQEYHGVYASSDKDEELEYTKNGQVLHIEFAKWADVLIIAPCSANTLAKLSNGLCDNLLTCIARAWNFDKQFIVAPAMNTQMWNHPTTDEHLSRLQSWNIDIVQPIEKTLYCGDTGIGAMADIQTITNTIRKQ